MPLHPRPTSPPAFELDDFSTRFTVNGTESHRRPFDPVHSPPRKPVPPQFGTYAASRMQAPLISEADTPYQHQHQHGRIPHVRNNLKPFYQPLDDVAARDFAEHFQESVESTPRAQTPTNKKKDDEMIKESEEMRRPLMHRKNGEMIRAARRMQPWITEQQPFSSPLLALLEARMREMLAKKG